jgi:hypothetical protein
VEILGYFSQCDQSCTLRAIKDIGLSLSSSVDTVAQKKMLGELEFEEGLLNRSLGLAAASGVLDTLDKFGHTLVCSLGLTYVQQISISVGLIDYLGQT